MGRLVRKLVAVVLAAVIITGTVSTAGNSVSAEGEETTISSGHVGNPYYGGYYNCTWTAWELVYAATGIALPSFGNAGSWAASAMNYGFYVSSVPAANTIVVWTGHVGFVSAVSDDGTMVYIKEGGFAGGYNEGWWPAYGARTGQALLGYIYLTDVPSQYYTTLESIQSVTSAEVAEEARKQKLVQEEAETIVTVDDAEAIEQDSLKDEEKQAISDVKEEDKSITVKQVD